MRRLLALLVVAAVAAPFVVAPADSRPPPRTLCPVCEELDDRDGVGDAPLAVEASTTTVRIDENGTGHWTTRVVVNDAAASELRRNETLRRELVDRAFHRHRVAVENPRDREVSVDGDTLVVTYRVPEMAHYATGGVLVVDFFYGAGDPGVWFEPGADSVQVRGPNGTTVTHAPDAGQTEADTVRFTSGTTNGDYLEDFFVAFAPEGGPGATLATAAALRATVLRAVVPLVPTLGAVPTALLAGAVGLTASRGSRLAGASRRRSVGLAVGGVVCLHLVLATAVAVLDREAGLGERLLETVLFEPLLWLLLTGAFLTGLVLAVLVWVQYRLIVDRDDATDSDADDGGWRATVADVRARLGPERRRATVVTAGLSLVVAVGGAVLSLVAGPGPVRSLAAVGPGLMFLPLAIADRRRAPVRHLLRGGIVVAPVALVLAVGPVPVPSPLLYAPWAGLTAVVGLVAYAAGREPGGPAACSDTRSEAEERSDPV